MSRQQTLDREEEEGCRADGGKESEVRWKRWETEEWEGGVEVS